VTNFPARRHFAAWQQDFAKLIAALEIQPEGFFPQDIQQRALTDSGHARRCGIDRRRSMPIFESV
jgi:hypothetical protein